ncbi:MAG: hypothetical protein PHH14_04185, partial [Candidatus Margulisbacteria bacterium]|nr:hypothetical protein [Candidatus Margulisiibacteriota bacterium]
MGDLIINSTAFSQWEKKYPRALPLDVATLKLIETMTTEVWEHNNTYMLDNAGRPYAEKDDYDLDADNNVVEYSTFSETI